MAKPSNQPNRFVLQHISSRVHTQSLSNSVQTPTATEPSHLERVHVHRVHERVAVKARHCGEKFMLSEINNTTASRPLLLLLLLLMVHCDTAALRMRGSMSGSRHRPEAACPRDTSNQ